MANYVYTFPVGLGRQNCRTPLISTKVVRKEADPVWRAPNSIREYVRRKTGEILPEIVFPDPKNPLGKYALRLSINGYLIHGTNAPSSVGTFINSGCMRLLREPLEILYKNVPIGTPVHVVYYPTKAGWYNNRLYLESHQTIKDYASKSVSPLSMDTEEAIYTATYMRSAKIDWSAVSNVVHKHLGIPEIIDFGL